MSPVVFGLLAGLAFGIVDVLLMVPLNMQDKTTAMAGAFAGRFAIGFLVPVVSLPLPAWVVGGFVGLLLSVPDAIITKAYVPILVIGTVGGLLVGLAAGLWVV